jgi:hypothetical protein
MTAAEAIAMTFDPAASPYARTFAFESDFVASLRCIPMAVRFKLDRVGIKLTLRQWSHFTQADRQRLLVRDCETPFEVTVYRIMLRELVEARTGDEARELGPLGETPWEDASRTADAVLRWCDGLGAPPPTVAQWAALSELERFVLVKLTRDNHDNVNFLPALREFGLSDRAPG